MWFFQTLFLYFMIDCDWIGLLIRQTSKRRETYLPPPHTHTSMQVLVETVFFWFFKICFWSDLHLLAVFIIFVLFCHQEVRLIHLVYRRTRELNSRPRTIAQNCESSTFTTRPGSFPNVFILFISPKPSAHFFVQHLFLFSPFKVCLS
jgi:hypothetical protein